MNGIRVMMFGSVREIVGAAEIDLPAGAGMTTGAMLRALVERYPALAPWSSSLRVAVNREYAPADMALSPGDEVAVIPPVSGG